MFRIAVLDAATLGDDLDLSPLSSVGEVSVFAHTSPDEVAERLNGVSCALVNKLKLGKDNLSEANDLRLICVAATGFDNIDLAYCRERKIGVCNVAGYSTDSVCQVTLATALTLATHIPEYTRCVRNGEYSAGSVANRLAPPYRELAGKTWGVVGCGAIGGKVAAVAEAMGCKVVVCRKTPDNVHECVDIDTLCRVSDVISIHVPLNASTRGMISRERIATMKPTALVINEARGAVTDEAALAEAVVNGKIGGLGCDVYSAEPFRADHPFYAIRELDNVCLTPHMAWGAVEARERLLLEIIENIKAFQRGETRSRVDIR